MALNMLRRDPATSWVFAVPSVVTRHKQCDQLPEDYRRAGIGHCMSGDHYQALQSYRAISIFISVKPKSHKNAQCNNENSSLPPYYAKLVRMRFSLPPRAGAAKQAQTICQCLILASLCLFVPPCIHFVSMLDVENLLFLVSSRLIKLLRFPRSQT